MHSRMDVFIDFYRLDRAFAFWEGVSEHARLEIAASPQVSCSFRSAPKPAAVHPCAVAVDGRRGLHPKERSRLVRIWASARPDLWRMLLLHGRGVVVRDRWF